MENINMNTYTLTTRLIENTTTPITDTQSISYSYPTSRKGFANKYSILGLHLAIETTKERGWDLYETTIRVAYTNTYIESDEFKDWIKEYKTSLGITSNKFLINSTHIERHSATKLQEAHDVGVIAGESYVLTILNKYIELLFNQVDKEVITRQINELQSALATL
jgi:3'-phosphoadenosine 5'-phosphosulfate sulfotransferase (PAPS reductase)/FAD synthetase